MSFQQASPVPEHRSGILHEVGEFIFTTLWLGVAFGIAMAGGTRAFKDIVGLRTVILQSLIVVAFAFVLHELAHRVMARRYGHTAEYRMWVPGLLIAGVAALMGWLFAAPGGVYIGAMGQNTQENRAKLGKTALAGPTVNLILAVLFGLISVGIVLFVSTYLMVSGSAFEDVTPAADFILGVTLMGVEINAWLALFNLLPIGSFDGYKVFNWSKKAWGIAFGASVALYGLWWWVQSAVL